MGKIIIENAIKREPNMLYYIDAEGNICETPAIRKGEKRKPKEKKVRKSKDKKEV